MKNITPASSQIKNDLDRRFAAAMRRYEKAVTRWHANGRRSAPPRLVWRPQPRPRPAAPTRAFHRPAAPRARRSARRSLAARAGPSADGDGGGADGPLFRPGAGSALAALEGKRPASGGGR
jgi:hypothetical protein